jgi:hypothetical protein
MSNSINVSTSEKEITIILKDTYCNKYGNAFLVFMSIFMIFFPLMIILWLGIKPNFGTFLCVLSAWFISSYFIKLLLWNLYGEEVFIIHKQHIETYNNYKYFKDNKKEYSYQEIDLIAYIDNKAYLVADIDVGNRVDEESVIGFYLDSVNVVNSFHKINLSKIIELEKLLRN